MSEKIQLFLRQAHCSSKVGGQDFFSLFSAFKHNNTCTYLGFNSRYFCAICSLSTLLICLKQRPSPYGHWTLSEQKTNLKVHRFTNNLQGLQKVTVKDFPWNITFWENIKTISILDIEIYGFYLNTCHDTAKRAETRVGFPVIFSRLRWPIEPKFLKVC